MMTGSSALHTLFDQEREIHVNSPSLADACFPRAKHLVNRVHQALSIFEHQAIKSVPLRILKLPAFESLQVQANGRNRSLEFVRDRIDKAVVLLVAPDLPHQKAGVQNQPSNDGAKKDDPEKDSNSLLPIENDPAKAHAHSRGRQQHSQRQKENDFPAPSHAHEEI